jgi:Uma2 family endonuclease
MTTLISPTEQAVLLDGVSWTTYEALLADGGDHRPTRIAYDQGLLEIMTPSFEHEHIKAIVATIVETILDTQDLDYVPAGSTTFRRQGLRRGFEPDASFYIEHATQVRGLTTIDLIRDPPPDLVIEIDITHPSLDKFPINAALGVPEIWRYNGERTQIYRLVDTGYTEVDASTVVPGLTSYQLTDFVQAGLQQPRPVWRRHIQAWAETQGEEQT